MMTTMRWICISSLFVFFVSCAGLSRTEQIQTKYGLRRIPEAKDFTHHEAVIVAESHNIDLSFDNNFEIYTTEETHLVKRVFRNTEKHAYVEIPIYGTDKLFSIEARTIQPDGSEVVVPGHEFHIATGVAQGNEFALSGKLIKFTFRNVQPGSILEYRVNIQKNFSFSGGVWWIQHDIPTLVNEMRLTVPTILLDHGWNWFYKSYAWDAGTPTLIQNKITNASKTEINRKETFVWRHTKIKAYSTEPYMPSNIESAGNIRFGYKTTWNELNHRINRFYLKNLCDPTSQTIEKAKMLTANATDDYAKADALFRFTQSIQLNMANTSKKDFTPQLPDYTLSNGSGDNEDKAVLLTSLLRSIGINADPVFARTINRGPMDIEFPTLNWFNHMIVRIDLSGQSVYADPSSSHVFLGELPWYLEDTPVMVVGPDSNATIIRLFSRPADENRTVVNIKAEPKENHGMRFDVNIAHYGNAAITLADRVGDAGDKSLEKICRSLLSNEFSATRIENIKIEPRKTKNDPLNLSFSVTIPEPITAQSDIFTAKLDLIPIYKEWEWLSVDKRKLPIRIPYAYSIQKYAEIKLPSEFSIRTLPSNVTQSSEFLNYSRTLKTSHQITINESFNFKYKEIPSHAFKESKMFFESLKTASDETFILTKN